MKQKLDENVIFAEFTVVFCLTNGRPHKLGLPRLADKALHKKSTIKVLPEELEIRNDIDLDPKNGLIIRCHHIFACPTEIYKRILTNALIRINE